MYIDSAYIVKYYLNEPGSAAVREILRKGPSINNIYICQPGVL
jgi:predicted nucleic acid-binding protein